MKNRNKFFSIIALLFFSCTSEKKPGAIAQEDSLANAFEQKSTIPTAELTAPKDTVFENGKFIVMGRLGSSVEFISRTKKTTHSGTFKDTLYQDHEVMIMGNFEDLRGIHILFNTKYSFKDFPAQIYKGPLADPDFSGNPYADDSSYREMIEWGCKNTGINFGDRYTAVESNCGCMCQGLHLVDRITGKILLNIGLNEGKWGFKHEAGSYLLIAHSELLIENSITHYYPMGGSSYEVPELYVWAKSGFKKLHL